MDFTKQKIKKIIAELIKLSESDRSQLAGFSYIQTGYKNGNCLPEDTTGWKIVFPGERFGGYDGHYWFYRKFKTPPKRENKKLYMEITTGRELVYDGNCIYHSVNPQSMVYLNGELRYTIDMFHREFPLEFETEYELFIYLYVGMIENLIEFNPVLKLIDEQIRRAYYDFKVAFDSAVCFDLNDDRSVQILKELDLATRLLDLRQPYSEHFYQGLRAASSYIKKTVYGRKEDKTVACIGHTHIDVAWLWTVRQSVEKVQRSFQTVLNLMEDYPDFKFLSSQPVLYRFVKQEAPELYEKIKARVAEGRWEVEGGMWLEADCNISSGESLIRQILFGKRFIKEEFGKDSKICWLPDVFGFNAALPQILKKSGINQFVTLKLAWNETNRMPYDAFMWQGIDGTQVFAYFLTARDCQFSATTDEKMVDYLSNPVYGAVLRPSTVLGTWERFSQKNYLNSALLAFGYGDGGGGSTAEMMENYSRLSKGVSGIPLVKTKFASEFLAEAELEFKENCEALGNIPNWVGELYLEGHRGTYTSVAKNKRNNRKSEFLYQTVETVSLIEHLLHRTPYPKNEINEGWERILLNQFHDILPGTSIEEVYQDSDKDYAFVQNQGSDILNGTLYRIAANIKTEKELLVYNPNSFISDGMVEYEGKRYYVCEVPAHGWKAVSPQIKENGISVTDQCLSNQFFDIVFDDYYHIVSFYDKRYDRELVKSAEGLNVLKAYEDYPYSYDAWEISGYYKDKSWVINDVSSVKLINEGEWGGYEITRKFLNSIIVQRICIYSHIQRVDFDTDIDWREEHILVKAEFPFHLNVSKATYDIPFGSIERPTHSNTGWDSAKFEVCAHKWADLSENDYGISLMNDCKYGYSANGSKLSLTILKSATEPYRNADKGKHKLLYSMYPHAGNHIIGGTVQEAYKVNRPFLISKIIAKNGKLPEEFSLMRCGSENIIIETVKMSESGQSVIVRLFDYANQKGKVKLWFGFNVKKAYITDLMENKIEEVKTEHSSLEIFVGNYEIVTLKLIIAH